MRGFKCESDDWCTPREYMCNGIPQCPDGSDEKEDTCRGKSQQDKENSEYISLSLNWIFCGWGIQIR